METNLYELVNTLNNRQKEIEILIEEIKIHQNNLQKEDLYNSLCRSTTILIVSHLEGFMKDLAKAIIDDINENLDFQNINNNLKKVFCKKFLGEKKHESDKEYIERQNELISTFNNLDTKLTKEPFLFKDNKNPKSDVINKICNNFGVRNIFSHLKNSKLDIVFEDDTQEISNLLDELLEYILNQLRVYPFNLNIEIFDLTQKTMLKDEKTPLEEFLEELLTKRHSIVHGNSINNEEIPESLIRYKNKSLILQYGIIIVMINKIFTR